MLLASLLCLALLGSALAQQASPYVPHQTVESFAVSLINGSTFQFNMQALSPPIIIVALNDEEPFSSFMLSQDHSVDAWLMTSPNNTIYLFLSHNSSDILAAARMEQLSRQLLTRMHVLKFTSQEIQDRQDHFAFAATAVSSNAMIAQLLSQWTTPMNVLNAVASDPNILNATWARFDGHYTWCVWPTAGQEGPVVYIEDGCGTLPDLTNQFALVFAANNCSIESLATNAQNANAVGVVVAVMDGQQLYEAGNNTAEGVNTIVTLITYSAGLDMMAAIAQKQVNVTFQTLNSVGVFAGIDSQGKLAELGWEKYANLMYLTYEAQWFNYEAELFRNLSLPALVIPVLDHVDMEGTIGAVGSFDLDPEVFRSLRKHEIFELDAQLTCPGSMDVDCETWDYTVNLNVCCYADAHGNPGSGDLCGAELGRWITPFRRGIGRWLSPVNQLLPLLTSTNCSFQMTTAPWSAPWISTLNLRFRKSVSDPVLPFAVIPLFQGGYFDTSYNNRQPISFEIPSGAKFAQLEAVITGHGSDENNCCEFAVTTHNFTLNGVSFVVSFEEAGDEFGCANKVMQGVEPNEHGTWYYGRDGWCDGQDVRPWVVDVTDVLIAGQNNTITYFATQAGIPPNLTSTGGEIILSSNIVWYANEPPVS